jgi:hypothetical protein
MRSGQVKPMLANVVQANTHIYALIGFVVLQPYRHIFQSERWRHQ